MYSNYKECKELLSVVLLPAEKMGKDTVGRRICDLFLSVQIFVFGKNVPVSKDLAKEWGKPEEEIINDALRISEDKNPPSIIPLKLLVEQLTGIVIQEDVPASLLVVTNDIQTYGAAVLFYPGILDRLYNMAGPFYILPSSVHEVIVLPYSETEPGRFHNMVREVNESSVAEEERLSDGPYLYDGKEISKVPNNM